jgi:hypothetical protein
MIVGTMPLLAITAFLRDGLSPELRLLALTMSARNDYRVQRWLVWQFRKRRIACRMMGRRWP